VSWLKLVKLPLRLYQVLFSPMLHSLLGVHSGCRFEPSCSRFAEEALELHGPVRGARLALGRILRCHPFSSGGIDPVPRYGIGSTRKVSATNGS
jgi:putative membrane protein insertion efficiency factor